MRDVQRLLEEATRRGYLRPCLALRPTRYPWTGSYEVVKKLSDATYRIIYIPNRKDRGLLSILIGSNCVNQEQDYHYQLSCLTLQVKSTR